MLKIDLRPGESIRIGDAVVSVEEKSGQKVRLAVDAARSLPIRRIDPAGHAEPEPSEALLPYRRIIDDRA